ncbi:MAG: HD domain-containing protein [Desemzia incerta]|uniref:HD domain-containing protein n=1 Tax=Desemzia incerta TaxID=82801 RepID=UPI001660CCA9|nr:HD domain-containing protein [Desemzia incerta]
MTYASWKLDSEYMALIEDLLQCEEVQNLQSITHHHFSTRLEHSLSVSYTSYKIAKKLNLNDRAIARAGLLHDFFHEDRESFAAAYEGYSHASHHPHVALQNAKLLTELTELECDIIVKHMWLASPACIRTLPKFKESYIVTMVDKYCATKEVLTPLPKLIKTNVQYKAKNVWNRLKLANASS